MKGRVKVRAMTSVVLSALMAWQTQRRVKQWLLKEKSAWEHFFASSFQFYVEQQLVAGDPIARSTLRTFHTLHHNSTRDHSHWRFITAPNPSSFACQQWMISENGLCPEFVLEVWFNLLKPSGFFTYHQVNPLNPELNPICYLLALLGAHHFLHVSRIRVKSLTFRRLISYIYIWSTHSWCF